MSAVASKPMAGTGKPDTPTAITLIEAITQALAWELRHDDSVVVLGEDVGVNGGVFRATAGLQQQFGALAPPACWIPRWMKPRSPA